MATSPDKGFLEQLREMRNTRMQQLRQGSQQAGLLNKQIAAMNTLNKTMESVLRAQNTSNATLKNLNTSQINVSRQTEQMYKSINNLSSSITKSMGSMASAVGKGTSGAVSAVGSAGGTVVGAASSVASGVASAVAKVLPFAIAGVVGKMMVWDKMDDSVKKDLTDSFGGLVESLFGGVDTSGLKKVTAPITKEFGIVFGALGDTLEGVTKQITKIVRKLEEIDFGSITKSLQNISNTVLGIVNNPELKYYVDKAKSTSRVIGDISENIPNVGVSEVAATGALAYSAYKASTKTSTAKQSQPVVQTVVSAGTANRMATATAPRKLTDKEIQIMQKSVEAMKKYKLGNSIVSVLLGRFAALSQLGMLSGAQKYLKLLNDNVSGKFVIKLSQIAAALISYFTLEQIYEQIDMMVSSGIVSPQDGDWLRGYLSSEEIASLVGSIVVGGAAATVGFVFGNLPGALAAGAGGGISGGRVGADIGREGYEFFNPMPETLKTTDFERKTENILKQQYYNQQQNTEGDKLRDLEKGVSRGSRPTAAVSDTQQVKLSASFIDFIKKTEGFRARPYGDYKQLSIGYGTKANSPDEVIDEKEAEKRMIEKLNGFQKTVLSYNSKYGYNWDQSQVEALTSFAYNAGEGNLNKLLAGGKRSNEEIASKMKEYNQAGGEINQGLVKRREVEMSLFTGGKLPSSDTVAQASMTNTSTSYSENVARRRQEAREAEKSEEGSDSFVGPVQSQSKKKKPLSDFASQFSLEAFSEGFNKKTSELTDVINSMTTVKDIETNTNEIEKARTNPTIVSDNSTVTNVINNSAGGGGGGMSVAPVTSDHYYNRNHQFHAMAGGGGYRA